MRTAKEAREAANKRRRSEKKRIANKLLDVESHRHCVVAGNRFLWIVNQRSAVIFRALKIIKKGSPQGRD